MYLAGRHSNSAVEPNRLTVEIGVLHYLLNQLGIFGRFAKSFRELHTFNQREADSIRRTAHHGGFENPRSDRATADAVSRKVASNW